MNLARLQVAKLTVLCGWMGGWYQVTREQAELGWQERPGDAQRLQGGKFPSDCRSVQKGQNQRAKLCVVRG